MEAEPYHRPVMLEEVIGGLAIRQGGIYVDATLGGAGHSAKILEDLGKGRLIVLDQDAAALENFTPDPRVLAIHQNFRHLARFLKLHGVKKIDGLLADLGVSSRQLDNPERGFSSRFDARLDMRMDRRQELDAAGILAKYEPDQLQKIFGQYGEVPNARTLAKTIVQFRTSSPITTTGVLKKAIQGVVKGNPHRYLAQVFQALRIEVNDELGALKDLLEQSAEILKPGGRLVILTFHSLEDRMVKRFLKPEQQEVPFVQQQAEQPLFRQLTKKPVRPGAAEVAANPRAASARLRVAERLNPSVS